MNDKLKKELEEITSECLEIAKTAGDIHNETEPGDEGSQKFHDIINKIIIPTAKRTSWIIGRSGCSLNYYSNEGNKSRTRSLEPSYKSFFIQKDTAGKRLG